MSPGQWSVNAGASKVKRTISSLQIGQASRGPAAREESLFSSFCSKDTRELRSWGSVDGCDVDADEVTEIELAEGESRLELRWGKAAEAGASPLPLPSTLPPPSFLDDIVRVRGTHESQSAIDMLILIEA